MNNNRAANGAPRHFLDLADIGSDDLRWIIDRARAIKAERAEVRRARPLDGKTLALVFDKPSMRTRVSFDLAMRELGGETIVLTGKEIELGRRESMGDTARVLSRYVDAIMIRTLDHHAVRELAAHATVPVINGLTKRSHPCQVMADVQTFEEHRGPIGGSTIAWTGDANNVLESWIHAAARFGFTLNIATPPGHSPQKRILEWAAQEKADVNHFLEAGRAVSGAVCVITDAWVSMGDEGSEGGHNVFKPYQVNAAMMAKADPGAIFMHGLPAHRGEEVTDEVMDSPQSVVFDEAENRLHAQKSILAWCFGQMGS